MNTAIMMMAMYNARPIIPSEAVAADWFNLSVGKFHEKIRKGDIPLPLVTMEDSQKCAKGVHLTDLADYIDTRRAAAEKELKLMGH
ncbi:pyocin activator PrtN family protein [Aliiroseovarius sp. F47248L]|uniref:pyocin activator PrtN family protein n=1 Tax=Aliiroseovarius sp. F47248L TaxID=2926420 RepID=UPI001FF12AD7|nr:pyocin activator PrtN family protein [Aliiroseovarius sp. F47248L]MCK0138651.1 pyocin activator PrtN family protein [Aliiroseovarius sp. F47248L]